MNQLVAQGAYAALEGAKRTDVKLVPFDLDPVSYQMVKDGKILGIIVQDPYKIGYEGMNAMVTKLTGGNAAGPHGPADPRAHQGECGRVRQRPAGDRQVAWRRGRCLARAGGAGRPGLPGEVVRRRHRSSM